MTSQRPALTDQPSAWALPDSLADRTYQYLEQAITTLRIPPGTVLSEALLSKQFGIDRTPVREALQRLAREGLVVITPRRRLMVPELDAATQLRLLPVRQELERLLVREVARCASNTQCQRFLGIAAGMDRSARHNDVLAFLELDREFNLLLLEACRGEFGAATLMLVHGLLLLHGLARRFWYAHYQQMADLSRMARLRAAVARAVSRRDERVAEVALDKLADYIREFTNGTVG